jgi:solute carrier family 25 S-adenosylmethionine transporter 26
VKFNFFNDAINGSTAGAIAGWIVTPIDVIKTRLMTYDLDKELPKARVIFRSIIENEGPKALFSGAQMRMLYLSVGGMAFFGIYEHIKRTMFHYFGEEQ